jgi:hypothetical protein
MKKIDFEVFNSFRNLLYRKTKINQLTCFVKTKFDLPKIDQITVQNEKKEVLQYI